MEKAGEEAKIKFLEEHPEMAGIDLKFDPLKELQEGRCNDIITRTSE